MLKIEVRGKALLSDPRIAVSKFFEAQYACLCRCQSGELQTVVGRVLWVSIKPGHEGRI